MSIADKLFKNREDEVLREYKEALDRKFLPDEVDKDLLASWLKMNNIKMNNMRVDTTLFSYGATIVGQNKANGKWYEIDFVEKDAQS